MPVAHLGVTKCGGAGDLENVCCYYHIDTGSIIRAELDLIE